MKKQLQEFLQNAFAPYGDFPSKDDVLQELLANLTEKYDDLKKSGKSDREAYQITVESLGDVKEIMEQLPSSAHHQTRPTHTTFKHEVLKGADLGDTDLTDANFTSCDLGDIILNGATLTRAKFTTSALKGATFDGATLVATQFIRSDLTGVSFDDQTLEDVVFDGSSLKNTSFKNATLRNVSFHHSAVKRSVFDGAKMDKVTYALLQGAHASLDNVSLL